MANWLTITALTLFLAGAPSALGDPPPRVNDESNFSDPSIGLWFGSSIASCTRDTSDLKLAVEHMASAAADERRYLDERVAASTAAYRVSKLKCMQSALRAHFSQVNGPAPNDAKLKDLKKNPEMAEVVRRLEIFGKQLQAPIGFNCNDPAQEETCRREHFARQQRDAGMGWALAKIGESLAGGMERRGSWSIRRLFDSNLKSLEDEIAELEKRAVAAEKALVRPRARPNLNPEAKPVEGTR